MAVFNALLEAENDEQIFTGDTGLATSSSPGIFCIL
jgi:hypothetical protein